MTSLVGDVAVKFSGLALGNSGTAAGAGAEGTCAGAAGTCSWAAALHMGRDRATSTAVPARRADIRIKLNLLQRREKLPALRLHLNLDGNGEPAAHAKRLGGNF